MTAHAATKGETAMRYEVTLTLIVEADSESAAYEVGAAAAEHLLETFNDDDSLETTIGVVAKEA
jgi:hypothetical protein